MVEPKKATSEISELIDLLKRYVLQETVGPLKTIGRSLGVGAGAAIAFGIGGIFVLIGVLRVLETETGTVFTGNWSWAPYLLTAVAGVLVIGLGAAGFLRTPKAERELRTAEVVARRPEAG
jgi:hypothetical protein